MNGRKLVERLRDLLRTERYAECVHAAEEALNGGYLVAPRQAEVQHILSVARLGLADYLGAVQAAEEAVATARRERLTALLPHALTDLGRALNGMRRYERALRVLEECLQGGLPDWRRPEALRELGIAYTRTGRFPQAKQALAQAREGYLQQGRPDLANASRRDLVQACLKAGDLEEAVPLLREGDRYLAEHGGDTEARVWHLLDQAEHAFLRQDHTASVKAALEALQHAQGSLLLQVHCHLLLYRNALAQAHWKDALHFALAARIAAIDCRRFDLEYDAVEGMLALIRAQGPGIVEELRQEYQGYGLDIFDYIPQSLVRRQEGDGIDG